MIKDWTLFWVEIEKLSLPELELMIKDLYLKFQKSKAYRDDRLNACLSQRKYLINTNFKLTAGAVNQIERVNRILTESSARVLKRTELLYRQMLELKAQDDGFLNDFEVEGTVAVRYNGDESLLTLDVDENNGQSDYHAMADILDFTNNAFEHLRSYTFYDRDNIDSGTKDEDLAIDDMLNLNWNVELLSAPELSSIEYICYVSHILFVDSCYSLSDIIRINDFCNEVKVAHRN